MARHTIAVVGIGKISQDQHLPVIAKNPAFDLVAVVSQRGVPVGDVPTFRTQAELFEAFPDLDAVANCVPPAVRPALVQEALAAGKHVLIEKPPAATISEFDDMVAQADRAGRVLFATWHSQFNAAVTRTRDILGREGVKSIRIDWRESVRKWHPGQDWVWAPGGFGVCDPGINALSILTAITPMPVFVGKAVLRVPANRQTPIDVEITFKTNDPDGPAISAGFNWLEESGEIWSLAIETATGRKLQLEAGGTRLIEDGKVTVEEPSMEYEAIYERFDALLQSGQSDTHGTPLRLMADAFLVGERISVEPFDW